MAGPRACLLVLAACLVAGVASELVIEQADRTIDISSFVAQQHLDFTLRNDGKAPAASVLLCEPAGLLEHASYYEAAIKGGAKLQWRAADAPAGAPAGTACREFTLAAPLAKGTRVVLAGAAVFTHVLRPQPAEMTQKDPQRVVFQGTAQLLSPYKVEKQSLELAMSESGEKPTATEVAPTKVASSRVSYGPYTQTAPFSSQPISVHYINNAHFAQVTYLEREIELSPWGNAYFEERYNLRHAGAKVVGEWSRFDLISHPAEAGRAAIPALAAVLPPAAHSLYFRDSIGNISSSETRRGLEVVTVNMQPRYPLFGGWSTTFLFGWIMPLREVVEKDRKSGRMVFTALLGAAVRDVVVDELTVKVVLPDGASNPVVRSQLPLAGEPEISHTYTYLDVVGRPVVVLRARNLVQELSLPFTVEYSYSSVGLLQKPLLLSGALALVFAAAAALNRVSPAAKPHAS